MAACSTCLSFCVFPHWRRQACRHGPLAHVYRQDHLGPTPDRLCPVSTGLNGAPICIEPHFQTVIVYCLSDWMYSWTGSLWQVYRGFGSSERPVRKLVLQLDVSEIKRRSLCSQEKTLHFGFPQFIFFAAWICGGSRNYVSWKCPNCAEAPGAFAFTHST
jgi:hypothetical protein